jgi:hypothetical protein
MKKKKYKKGLQDLIHEHTIEFISNKEAFIKGFIIGRGIHDYNEFLKNAQWRYDYEKGEESFYYNDVKLMTFKIKIETGMEEEMKLMLGKYNNE